MSLTMILVASMGVTYLNSVAIYHANKTTEDVEYDSIQDYFTDCLKRMPHKQREKSNIAKWLKKHPKED